MTLESHIATTFLVRILRLFFGFANMMIMARWLEPEGMGILASFLAVPMMLISLGELGIRQSIAFHVGQKKFNIKEIAGVVTSLWLSSSILSIMLVLAVFYYQGLFKHGVGTCIVGSGLVAAHLFTRYANGIALGRQWIGRMNLGEACNLLTRFILIMLLLVIFDLHVWGVLWMEMIAIMVPGLLIMSWLSKYLHLSFKPRVNGALLASLFVHGIKYALVLFAVTINYRVGVLFLQSHDVPNDQIGHFSVGMKIAELIWLLPAAVGTVVFSYSTASKNTKEFSLRTAQAMRLSILLCGFGALMLAMTCPLFVKTVFGEGYLPSVTVIRWMLPGIVVMVVFKVLNADLAGRGKPLISLKGFVFALIANVALNLVLVPTYGVTGSAIASTVSYIIGVLIFLRVYSTETGISSCDIVWNPTEDVTILCSSLQKFIQAGHK